jgi:GNAT superfamily N-acetyltransferase
VRLPSDPRALAAALPDLPRWVETRSLLLSGDGLLTIGEADDAGVVMDRRFPSGAVVGRGDRSLLQDVLAAVPADFELVVQLEALADARAALPAWKVAFVTVHAPARPFPGGEGTQAGVVVSAPPDGGRLEELPEDIRRYAAEAYATAVRVVDGVVVAVCAAGDVTETLWDVGIDTLAAHRRRGHASACVRALAGHMAREGRQPVWAAEEDNVASMRLAAKLGFRPVDRLAVLSRCA